MHISYKYVTFVENKFTFMDKKTGYEYATEQGYIVDRGNFYKLFKTIAKIKSLTPAEKIVLSVILSYTDNGQEFYMSNNRLAMEVGMNYSSAVRVISSLRTKGFIKTYKVINRTKNLIIGRIAVPQKDLMLTEVKKTWDVFDYEEYTTKED